MKKLKRYIFPVAMLAVTGILYLIDRTLGGKAVSTSLFSFREMLGVLPPVFILLGLLDVWVPKEKMIKYLGEKSGLKGVILSFILGSAAAGPLYGAFPVAAVLMNKGAGLFNVLVFIGAWSTTKIPMMIFEITSLGAKFALTRLAINIPGIILIAFTIKKLSKDKEIDAVYENMQDIAGK